MAAHRLSGRQRLALRLSTRKVRVLVSVIAVLTTVLAATGVAFAFFTASGSGTGTVTTSTLNPPTAVSGVQTPGSGTVTVSWTAPSGTPAPTGYYVLRSPSPSGTAQPACGTTASSTINATSCFDSGVALGSYTYVVVAVFHTWSSASTPSAVVTVAQASQSINFTSSPSSPTYLGTYAISATGGGSGNPVTFSSATPGVCTVSGSTATFVHAGTCTINANQAGSTYYSAAPQAQQTFVVAKAAQTITYTSTAPAGAVVGGPGYTPTATGGGSGNPVTFTIDATTSTNCSIAAGSVTYQHVGSCTIDANQAGNADYLAANQVQQSYAIGQGSQAIAFTSTAPANAKVNGSTYNVTATGGASGNAVTFTSATPSVCTVSGSTVSFVGSGTCTINANQAGNTDYLAAAQVQQSFAVTKNDQTITFTSTAPVGASFGGSYAATATASSGLTVTFSTDTSSVCTVTSGGSVSFVGVGTCHVNADQAGNSAFNAAPQVTQSFTVSQASQTITFNALANKTFGNAPFTVSATGGGSGNPVTFSTTTTTVCTTGGTNGSTVTIVGAGSCTIKADQAGNTNYSAAAQVPQSFTVAQASQTITFNQPTTPATATTSDTLVFSASSGLTVTITPTDATVCSVSGTTVNYLKAGTCTLTASQAGNTNYTAATNVVRTVTVNLAPQTITFTQPTTPANAGTSATVSPTASSGLNVALTTTSAGTICTVTGGPTSYTVNYIGAGNCVLNANQAGNGVYAPATQVQRTVVVQAADTVAPTISNVMRGALTWQNNNNGNGSWNQDACSGNQLCATITDAGTPTSGVNPATITFSLVGVTGANAGKCFQTSTSTFVAGPCTITTAFASNVATATVPQAAMLDGTYTFTINAKDNAGNSATQQVVTLTIN